MSSEIERVLGPQVEQLKKDGIYRVLPVLNGPNQAEEVIDGRTVINLSANNYLGFATNERIKKASIAAIEKYGVGAGAVRPIGGNDDLHEELDKTIARFKGEEAAHHFQSGFMGNLGAIPAIVKAGDLIISDALNHASIIDGIKQGKADKAIYKHLDMEDLERVLKEKRDQYDAVLIITDGVFSMDGELAPLPQIVELAKKYRAMTYVDDAHGSGVLGKSGRGTVDHFGLNGQVDFIMGTLSKAIGSIGGYIATTHTAYEWLSHRARPILFSTSLPPAAVAASIEAFKILEETDEYTIRLWDNAKYFKEKLEALGFNTGHSETPITPVIIGDEALAMKFSSSLLEKGIMIPAIIFPTVPKGTGRLRCMISADHTKEQLDRAVEAFAQTKKELLD